MTAEPVFIIGTPRSGTTLLAKVLNRHSNLFMPGETHFFGDIYAQREQIGDLSAAESQQRLLERLSTLYGRYNEPDDQERVTRLMRESQFLTDPRELRSYKSALSYFMDTQLADSGKARWGNNAPKDLFFAEDIQRFYPRAQFILCVRDIRDFLGSYRSKWKITEDDQAARLKKLYHPVITSLLWKASTKRIIGLPQSLGSDSIHVVKYEDLVTQPEEVVRALCTFLGENFEAQMLDVAFSNSSQGRAPGAISAESVGSWEETLSREEAWLAQCVASKQMQVLGYESQRIRPNPLLLVMWCLSAPVALLKALIANRKNTGPVLPYLLKRVKSLLR